VGAQLRLATLTAVVAVLRREGFSGLSLDRWDEAPPSFGVQCVMQLLA
jgi:hypothetical protein